MSAKIINIQEAKTHLSRLVEQAVEGTQVVIGKAGKPLVTLTPYAVRRAPRVGGFAKGQVWEAADCWDSSEDLLGESLAAPLYVPSPAEPSLKVAEDGPP